MGTTKRDGNHITMHWYRETRTMVQTPSYEFNRSPKWWSFVQDWAWKLLLKTGGLKPWFDEKIEVKKATFNRQDLAKYIFNAKMHIQYDMNHVPKHIYMGGAQFQEFLNMPYDNLTATGFTIDMVRHSYEGRKIFEVPVTIVPWMDGVLIV